MNIYMYACIYVCTYVFIYQLTYSFLLIVFHFQVKAIVVNDRLEVLQEAAVQFDNDLPEYRLVLSPS